jgi:hypothetical protein
MKAAKPLPIIQHYVCGRCNRRHSTRTAIGREHLHHARAPKGGRR